MIRPHIDTYLTKTLHDLTSRGEFSFYKLELNILLNLKQDKLELNPFLNLNQDKLELNPFLNLNQDK